MNIPACCYPRFFAAVRPRRTRRSLPIQHVSIEYKS
jgi:hypothetical protein